MKTKQRQYKYLGNRVENIYTGITGRIARATPRKDVKKGWNIIILWDDGHDGIVPWTEREVGNSETSLNRIVHDDYAPDYGPIPDRVWDLIHRIEKGGIDYIHRHSTTVHVGMDSLGIWRPSGTFHAHASLWAGQGEWNGEGSTQKDAWDALKEQLTNFLKLNQ